MRAQGHADNVGAARGPGRVLALEVLARKVVVEFEDRRRIVVGHDEILGVEKAKATLLKDEDDDRDERGSFVATGG